MLFEATQVAIAEPDKDTEDVSPEDKIVSILPMFRMNTHTRPVFGSHTATQDGVYEIVFDNTYSRWGVGVACCYGYYLDYSNKFKITEYSGTSLYWEHKLSPL